MGRCRRSRKDRLIHEQHRHHQRFPAELQEINILSPRILLIIPILVSAALIPTSIAATNLVNDAGITHSQAKPRDDQDKSQVDLTPEALRARLDRTFVKYETKHFVIFSDADGPTVRTLTATLEKTLHQFERSCRRLDLKTTELTRKFPCVLFNQRAAFQKFAVKYDDIAADWVGGYFANAGNYMVFYAAQDTPGMAQAEKQFAEWETELANIKKQIRTARAAGKSARAQQLDEYARNLTDHIKTERQRLDDFTDAEAEGRTIHETVHLLAFNTGIQVRERLAPFWLSEGLATNFESKTSQGAFGPDFENERRRASFEELLRNDQLLPLSELLAVTDATTVNNDRAEILYQQTYALFRWLYRFRRQELSAFFKRYALHANEKDALPYGKLTEQQHLDAFTKTFGNIPNLEKRWLRAERSKLK